MGENNKLSAQKIGPLEIIENINPYAYCLKLPSHIHTTNVSNIKHLIPYSEENSFDEDVVISRSKYLAPKEDDTACKHQEHQRVATSTFDIVAPIVILEHFYF